MRILIAIKQRGSSDIQASTIRGDDEIRIVLCRKTLHGFDRLTWVGLIVILNDLDHLLATINHQSAFGIHLIGPKRNVRPLGYNRTTCQRTRFRGDGTNLYHIGLGQCQSWRRKACRCCGAQFKRRSTFHNHAMSSLDSAYLRFVQHRAYRAAKANGFQ